MRRLILIILVLGLFLAFILLNIDNKCDISFGIKTFTEIPVFVSVLFAFVLGMLFALPFGISLSMRLRKTSKPELPAEGKKKRWGKKGKGAADNAPAELEEVKKDSGPNGVG